tara:strand:+ start:221 stop:601 length:381 start_codon:yes stop_codon:yes gene_type:complete
MKLKITLLIIEIDKNNSIVSNDFFRVLVDENNELPYRYVSTKTIEETIREIYNEYCNIDMGWSVPTLKDLRHEKGSTESEAVYYSSIPAIGGWNKKGNLVTPHELELEAFYESIIIHEPRGLYRNT